METKFNVGDILTDKNTSTRYRIICIKSNQVVLCQMNCDTLNLYSHDIRVVASLIETFIKSSLNHAVLSAKKRRRFVNWLKYLLLESSFSMRFS